MNYIKRVVAGPGDTIAIKNGHVILNGKRQNEPSSRHECGDGGDCNFMDPDHHSRRALVHDGRQPWRVRRQPLLGTGPARWIIGGAFATYWPPNRIGLL